MLLPEFIREGAATLEALYPPKEARSLVLRLCSEVLGTESYTHIVEPKYEIPAEKLTVLQDNMKRLADGEPLQYVLGYQEFLGRRFHVAPGVLIPRPETELLVADAIARCYVRPLIDSSNQGPRVLDLCTGSGCIAWSIALEVPGAIVTGVDISKSALEIASSQFSGVAPRFVKADVLQLPEEFDGAPFDLITANPPYIRESEKAAMHRNVLEHEPGLALFVPDDDALRFYRAIALWAQRFLKTGGSCIVEINEALGDETVLLFEAAGFKEVKKHADFFGKDRFVSFKKAA